KKKPAIGGQPDKQNENYGHRNRQSGGASQIVLGRGGLGTRLHTKYLYFILIKPERVYAQKLLYWCAVELSPVWGAIGVRGACVPSTACGNGCSRASANT